MWSLRCDRENRQGSWEDGIDTACYKIIDGDKRDLDKGCSILSGSNSIEDIVRKYSKDIVTTGKRIDLNKGGKEERISKLNHQLLIHSKLPPKGTEFRVRGETSRNKYRTHYLPMDRIVIFFFLFQRIPA